MRDPVSLAQKFCTFAGWYGLITLFPLLFRGVKFGSSMGPTVNHPEFYYGFIVLGISWQIAFLMLGRAPLPYRGFFLPAGIEKLTFAICIVILFYVGKVPATVFAYGLVDLFFAIGFLYIWKKLSNLTM